MPYIDVGTAVLGLCGYETETIPPQPGMAGCGAIVELRVMVATQRAGEDQCAARLTLDPDECRQLEEVLRLARQELAQRTEQEAGNAAMVCPACGYRSDGLWREKDGDGPWCVCGRERMTLEEP